MRCYWIRAGKAAGAVNSATSSTASLFLTPNTAAAVDTRRRFGGTAPYPQNNECDACEPHYRERRRMQQAPISALNASPLASGSAPAADEQIPLPLPADAPKWARHVLYPPAPPKEPGVLRHNT